MKLCGSCFKHSTPKDRLFTLCSLYVDPATETGLCDTCRMPLVPNPSWSPHALVNAIKRTATLVEKTI